MLTTDSITPGELWCNTSAVGATFSFVIKVDLDDATVLLVGPTRGPKVYRGCSKSRSVWKMHHILLGQL